MSIRSTQRSTFHQMLLAAALGGLLCASPTLAQQGGARGERPGASQQRPERPERPDRSAAERPSAEQAEVHAWVRTLMRGMGHTNPVIQRSAAQAIIAVGRPAMPVLREVAGGADEELAARARRVAAQIERAESEAAASPAGRLLAELELSGEQREQVQQVLRAHQMAMRSVMQEARERGATPEQTEGARLRLRSELVSSLQATLTAEQAEQVAQALDRRGAAGGVRRPQRPGAESERPGGRQPAQRPQRQRGGVDRP